MKVLHRKHMNKRAHSKTFRRHGQKTKSANVRSAPQRGGWRL